MSGARTERPTPRRISDARRRGEIASSREVTALVASGCGAAAVLATSRETLSALRTFLHSSIVEASSGDVDPAVAISHAAGVLAASLAAPLLAACGGAIAAGVVQSGGLFAPAAAAWRWDRVAGATNLRRVVNSDQLIALAAGLARAFAALAIGWWGIRDSMPGIAQIARLDAWSVGSTSARLVLGVMAQLAAVLAASSALDLLLARSRHTRALRMTREEVRREQREEEGDPQRRAERQRRHRALLDIVPVSRATCVVVNPTHIAIALLHDRCSDAAPLVIAKAAGDDAARVRAEAARAGVPVVRDVVLARALWKLGELGEQIPEELYEAAAAVLVHVHGIAPEAA